MLGSRLAIAWAAILFSSGSVYVSHIAHAQMAAQPETGRQSGTQCYAAEKVVFNCELPKKTASVCKTPEQLIFRYGELGKPDVTVASDGRDGKALSSGAYHIRDVYMEEVHARFKQGEMSYMVVSGEFEGANSKIREKSANLTIFTGADDGVTANCTQSGTSMDVLKEAVKSLPEEAEGAIMNGFYQ